MHSAKPSAKQKGRSTKLRDNATQLCERARARTSESASRLTESIQTMSQISRTNPKRISKKKGTFAIECSPRTTHSAKPSAKQKDAKGKKHEAIRGNATQGRERAHAKTNEPASRLTGAESKAGNVVRSIVEQSRMPKGCAAARYIINAT